MTPKRNLPKIQTQPQPKPQPQPQPQPKAQPQSQPQPKVKHSPQPKLTPKIKTAQSNYNNQSKLLKTICVPYMQQLASLTSIN